MSGNVEGYVRRDDQRKSTQTPPLSSTQPQSQYRKGRLDRLSARELKVKWSEKQAVNQRLPSTAPAPGYHSIDALRNTYPNPRYIQQEQHHREEQEREANQGFIQRQDVEPFQGGAFDDTLTSGFDDTKSDLSYNDDPRIMDARNVDENDNQYELQQRTRAMGQDHQHHAPSNGHHSKHFPHHDHLHKQSRPPHIDVGPEHQPLLYGGQQMPAISGRFQGTSGQPWPQDIVFRDGVADQQAHASRQKPRSDVVEDDNEAAHSQRQNTLQQDCDDLDESDEDGAVPAQQAGGDGQQAIQEAENPHSDGAVSGTRRCQTRRDELNGALMARFQHHNPHEPDYDDKKLKSMTYADLKKETWDIEPKSEPASQPNLHKRNATKLQNTDLTVEACVEYVVQNEGADSHVEFFEQLSMEEFEQAGDFFIDKFAELMKKIRDARKKKRDLVMEFEDEIERREMAVRGKSENLESKFNDMRAGGEGVLKRNI